MGKRKWLKDKWNTLMQKLHIASWQAILHFVVVEIALNLIWDRVSSMFQIVAIREVGFLVVFVAGLFAVAWYLPKLEPALYSLGSAKIKKQSVTRLEHDSVLWQDGGNDNYGYIKVIGPLCQKDITPLAVKLRDGRIETSIKWDTIISSSEYPPKLICPECDTEYTLGVNPKKLEDSHNEVRSRFEGKRRRDYQS